MDAPTAKDGGSDQMFAADNATPLNVTGLGDAGFNEQVIESVMMTVHEEAPEDATLEQIKVIHRDNQLEDNQFKSAKDYMNKVMYQVPLNKLYEVMHSCQYNEKGAYCPVQLRVVNEAIKEQIGKEFLLQVWNKRGQMLFEKQLDHPIANWNISQEWFVFQETTHSRDLHLVQFFDESPPITYKFTLPESIQIDGRINSVYDARLNNYVVASDDKKVQKPGFDASS